MLLLDRGPDEPVEGAGPVGAHVVVHGGHVQMVCRPKVVGSRGWHVIEVVARVHHLAVEVVVGRGVRAPVVQPREEELRGPSGVVGVGAVDAGWRHKHGRVTTVGIVATEGHVSPYDVHVRVGSHAVAIRLGAELVGLHGPCGVAHGVRGAELEPGREVVGIHAERRQHGAVRPG